MENYIATPMLLLVDIDLKIATMVITLVNCKFYMESGDKDDKRNIKHIAKDICSTVQ